MAAGVPDPQRYAHIYLPSRGEKARWENLSEGAGYKSLSKWVYHHVEHSLRGAKPDLTEGLKLEFLKRIQELETEAKELKAKLQLREIYEQRIEEDLKEHRKAEMAAFLQGSALPRRYDVKLVKILRQRGEVRNSELLQELGIDPKEVDVVAGLYRQLNALKDWGFVEPFVGGWRWTDGGEHRPAQRGK